MKLMMFCMFILSVLAMIPMFIYASKNGLNENDSLYWKNQYSLGNLGFSATTCQQQYLIVNGYQKLSCAGEATITQLFSYGLIPGNSTTAR
mmetsp:Transcript_14895/g.10799  ORF Transcript_14895/g.10799 Transcript_14895/m.10799 type:complete len:91 (-) Transcript_14895:149-421(-)